LKIWVEKRDLMGENASFCKKNARKTYVFARKIQKVNRMINSFSSSKMFMPTISLEGLLIALLELRYSCSLTYLMEKILGCGFGMEVLLLLWLHILHIHQVILYWRFVSHLRILVFRRETP